MNILVTVNSAFVRQSLVLIKSILSHNQYVHIYVLYSELEKNEMDMVEDFCAAEDVKVFFIKIDKSLFAGFRTAEPFPCEVYLRLFAHVFLPEDIEKVLYLDIDIICNGNLKALYDTDLKEHPLLACARDDAFCDSDFLKANWNEKDGLRGKYFNSGVLLLNCKKMRERYPDAESIKNAVQSIGNTYLFDQGVLNYLYAKDSLLISSHVYNFRYGYYFLNSQDKIKDLNISDLRIIHYSGEVTPYKPWDICFDEKEIEKYSGVYGNDKISFVVNKQINDLSLLWWEYAKDTFVYDELLYEMTIKKEWFKRGISSFLKRLSVL